MKNAMKLFVSLALFAQLIVLLSATHKSYMGSKNKLRNFSENEGRSTTSVLHLKKPIEESNHSSPEDNRKNTPNQRVNNIDYPNSRTVPEMRCDLAECLCDANIDVALIVESAFSVGEQVWMETYDRFIRTFVERFDIAEDKAHMALAVFTTETKTYISFRDEESRNKSRFLEIVDSIIKVGTESKTYLPETLFYSLQNMFLSEGVRKDATKVSVLVSEGHDDGIQRLVPLVLEAYRFNGVKIVTVGMETSKNKNMYDLAGCNFDIESCATAVVIHNRYFSESVTEAKNKVCKFTKP